MSNHKEQLVEQHIRQYQSRLKHIDELYQRAKMAAAVNESSEVETDLANYARQRELLRQKTDEIKTMHIDNWREETLLNAGPMAVWDIVAQSLEDFIERHERHDA